MAVYPDSHVLQLALEEVRRRLAAVLGDHHTAHVQARVDGDDDLGLVRQLQQHPELAVRGKAGKHAGRVVVVKQLPAELQVQLVPKLADALPDVFRLHFQVFLVVKSNSHILPPSMMISLMINL